MIFYRLLVAFIAFVAFILLFVNVRLYTPLSADEHAPTDEAIIAQLRFLDDAISNGAADDMQATFPEGFVFLHVLHGLSWTEVARKSANPDTLRRQAIAHARGALQQLESPEGRHPFTDSLNPPFGIFYSGWKAWLRGTILAAGDTADRDTAEVCLFSSACTAIANAFDSSSSLTPFLQTYPGSAWPADMLVAVAALRLHDHLFTPRFAQTIERWMEQVTSRLDPATGLIAHRVDDRNGSPLGVARGSSQSLMLRFLIEIDPAFARAQYDRYREMFTTTWLGLPGIREYPHGNDGNGDIDSGPVGFGIGAAATIVGIGTAQMFGDHELASPMNSAVETLGLPLEWNGRRRYLFGAMPIGDAFLVWSRLARPYTTEQGMGNYQRVTSWWWRLPFHVLTGLIVVLLWLIVKRKGSRVKLIARR